MAEEPSSAFIGALVNEQFGLQSVSGATIGESGSRAALYFSSLSSGLVALGFASASATALPPLAFTILPTVFVLGCFTVVRLVDTSVQSLVALQRIELIRQYWATLDPRGPSFFPADASAAGSRGVRYGALSALFTTATMVAVVNSVVGGAIASLVLILGLRVPVPVAVLLAVVVGAVILLVLLRYQRGRLERLRAPA